jgi:integrase
MATAKLTKTTVESVTPETKDVYVWDMVLPRFGVRITPDRPGPGGAQARGPKIYLVQYRARGMPGEPPKTRRITIGQHGRPWTVETARDEAKKILARVDLQQDPFADRQSARIERGRAEKAAAEAARLAEQRLRDVFEVVAERYIHLRLSQNRSGAETARLIRHDAIPAWRGRHIAEIRRADLADLIDTIKPRSPAVARATYAALRGLFNWCRERDLIETSPCEAFRAPPRPDARDRVLSDEELRLVWQASKALGHPYEPVVKLLMLTGQRRAEVGGLRWDELDLEAGHWRIPKERSKNGRAHEVDLSPQAVVVITDVARDAPYLFPARGVGAVRGFSAIKRKLDKEIDALLKQEDSKSGAMAPWRLHDLRRTAATGMAGLGIAPHIVERVLNHVSGVQSGLVGVYQRHEYRAERKAAMVAWGAHVQAALRRARPASNVVALRT